MEDFVLLHKLSAADKLVIQNSIELRCPKIIDILQIEDSRITKPKKLKYLKIPAANAYPLDLNRSIADGKHEKGHYARALEIIQHHLTYNSSAYRNGGKKKMNVYTTRFVLYKIMLTPYRWHVYDNWTLLITKFKGNLYIQNHKIWTDTPFDKVIDQFCRHIFADSPNDEPDLERSPDSTTYCIYKSQLKNFNLIYSGAVQGIMSDQTVRDINNISELNGYNFVQAKLIKSVGIKYGTKNPKFLCWWLQAFLSNVHQIFVGKQNFLNPKYVSEPIETLNTTEILKNTQWTPAVCMQFLYKFLKLLNNRIGSTDCPYTVYEVNINVSEKIINYKRHDGKTNFTFLNDDFINLIQQ